MDPMPSGDSAAPLGHPSCHPGEKPGSMTVGLWNIGPGFRRGDNRVEGDSERWTPCPAESPAGTDSRGAAEVARGKRAMDPVPSSFSRVTPTKVGVHNRRPLEYGPRLSPR